MNNTLLLNANSKATTVASGLTTTIYNDKGTFLTLVDYYVTNNEGHELYYGRLIADDEITEGEEDFEYYTDVLLFYDLDKAVCFIYINDDKANVLDILDRIIGNDNIDLYYEGCFD